MGAVSKTEIPRPGGRTRWERAWSFLKTSERDGHVGRQFLFWAFTRKSEKADP